MDLNYKILKLKNGDSIICEVGETTDNTVSLHRPMVFKVVTMLNETMTPTDVLLFRNWAEFGIEKDISITTDIIAASWSPDELMMNCYELEKLKQDMPELYKLLKKNDNTIPGMPPVNPPTLPPGMIPPGIPKQNATPNGMANFNLTLPMDVAKELIQFLEEQGVNLQGPAFPDDMDDEIEEFGSELVEPIDDDLPFGNHPEDWSPDPNDYLK